MGSTRDSTAHGSVLLDNHSTGQQQSSTASALEGRGTVSANEPLATVTHQAVIPGGVTETALFCHPLRGFKCRMEGSLTLTPSDALPGLNSVSQRAAIAPALCPNVASGLWLPHVASALAAPTSPALWRTPTEMLKMCWCSRFEQRAN